MTIGKTALIALLVAGTTTAALAQANGDPGAMANGAARAKTEQAKTEQTKNQQAKNQQDKAKPDTSGGNAMQKGKSGNSGPQSGGMGGSNAMSGSGRKPGR